MVARGKGPVRRKRGTADVRNAGVPALPVGQNKKLDIIGRYKSLNIEAGGIIFFDCTAIESVFGSYPVADTRVTIEDTSADKGAS